MSTHDDFRAQVLSKVEDLADLFENDQYSFAEWLFEPDLDSCEQDPATVGDFAMALGYLMGVADCCNKTLMELLDHYDIDPSTVTVKPRDQGLLTPLTADEVR